MHIYNTCHVILSLDKALNQYIYIGIDIPLYPLNTSHIHYNGLNTLLKITSYTIIIQRYLIK